MKSFKWINESLKMFKVVYIEKTVTSKIAP